MSMVRRMKRKFQRGNCCFDEVVGQLKGGLQEAPPWFNSVRKYPPERMYLTPGKVPRPSEFWGDKVRQIILKNRRRPDWIPSLHSNGPNTHNIMAGAQFNDAFGTPSHSSNPDIEFAACQAWFMFHKRLSEEEAYEQAKFRMRDLIKQKERIWHLYYKTRYQTKQESTNQRKQLCDEWINTVKNELKISLKHEIKKKKENIFTQIKNSQNIKDENIENNELINNERLSNDNKSSVVPNLQNLINQNKLLSEINNDNTDIINTNENENENIFDEEHNKYLNEMELEFNKEWEDKIKCLRFIEYTNYLAKNPHLGLKDPTDILLGVPQKYFDKDNIQNDLRTKLLIKMANKQTRLPNNNNKLRLTK